MGDIHDVLYTLFEMYLVNYYMSFCLEPDS